MDLLTVHKLGEAEVEDVGVKFGQSACESVSAQVLPTELTVAEFLGQVDVQDVGEDGAELSDETQSSTDGVGWVQWFQLWLVGGVACSLRGGARAVVGRAVSIAGQVHSGAGDADAAVAVRVFPNPSPREVRGPTSLS